MKSEHITLRRIGRIHTAFTEKFGIPRQSGLAPAAEGKVVLEGTWSSEDCVRGLADFSHIWILWGFSEAGCASATVRPPKLGGNRRVGVFATRSPFRPNPIALSLVRLAGIEKRNDSLQILFSGADMLDGSPVYDIKPYVPADCCPDARTGFAAGSEERLPVLDSDGRLSSLPEGCREAVQQLLSLDPRPAYHNDPERVYGMQYAGFDVRFQVSDGSIVVTDVVKESGP